MFKKLFHKFYKFIVVMITILLYNFHSDEDGSSKKRNFYLNNMDSKDIYYETLDIKKEIEKLNNDLVLTKEEKKKKITNLLERIDNISKANNDIKTNNKKDLALKEETDKLINKNTEILKNTIINNKLDIEKKEIKEKKKKNKDSDDKIIHKEINEEDINLKENKDKDSFVYLSYVIMTNKILKDTKTTLEEIDEDIKNNIYHENDKYKVEMLKEKIKKIRENYYEFKHNRYIYELENNYNLKEIDKFEVLVNSSNIDSYIKKCNIIIEKLNEFKKHEDVITNKIDKPKEEKVKEPKVKEEKKPKHVIEMEEAYTVVKKDVLKNQMLLDEFEKKLFKLPTFEKRKCRMNFLDVILNTTFKIGFAILPFKFIRNSRIKKLVEAYMVNNSIRTMRKSISPDIVCEYQYLRAAIKETNILSDYSRILSDSLYQVSVLKEEYVKYYGYLKDDEFKKIYMKLIALEDTITMDLERINENKKYVNNKVKILTKNRGN